MKSILNVNKSLYHFRFNLQSQLGDQIKILQSYKTFFDATPLVMRIDTLAKDIQRNVEIKKEKNV